MSELIAARAKFAKLQEEKVLEVTQKLTLDVGRKLIEGSPVDTGDFRGAWQIETPTKPGDVGRITNPTPYGPDLARGRSDQAPNGWIENAVEAAVKFKGKP
ncbi:hypothetical protein [Sphingomonas paucimobilis]|uniref:hypothetical protein n=1 Tax=Sphingomonas paucimobilis TaxID=13689 RepID=UPI0031D6F196